MKSIIYTEYGLPEKFEIKEVEKPTPQANEVLVKVVSSSVNAADWHLILGEPKFARFGFGLFKPKSNTPGIDITGIVEAVGKDVKEFKPGDEVFGDCSHRGGFAEYACADEDKIVLKPANITFEEAGAVNVAAITALQALKKVGPIQHGQAVLINGASGGVGIFAMQIAKHLGARVTAVCSTRNIELAQSIGANHVIDYKKEDFTLNEQKYDFIIDVVGNRTVSEYKRALKPTGYCLIVGFKRLGLLMQHMVIGKMTSKKGGKRVEVMETAKPNKDDLSNLKELLESRAIKTIIDKTYPLSESADAVRYLLTEHARAKVVVKIV